MPRKSSPARQKYQAENYARRNASRLAAQAMHRAAVKAAVGGEFDLTRTEKENDQ